MGVAGLATAAAAAASTGAGAAAGVPAVATLSLFCMCRRRPAVAAIDGRVTAACASGDLLSRWSLVVRSRRFLLPFSGAMK